jgi:murein DD-endopeptidase MepM/ murein hydrolase activator NlpD
MSLRRPLRLRTRAAIAALAGSTLLVGAVATAAIGDADPVTQAPALAGPYAIAGIDRKIGALSLEEQKTKKELSSVEPLLEGLHARSVARGRELYKLTRMGMLPIGGGFDELVRHAMHVERTRRAVEIDLEAEREAREHGVELTHSLERLAQQKILLASQRVQVDNDHTNSDDENRRSEAFARAFQSKLRGGAPGALGVTSGGGTGASMVVASGGGDLGGGFGSDSAGSGSGVTLSQPDGPSSRARFAQEKGRLLFPVGGRADVRPARREGTDGPGLEISAPVGTPVRAVFAGRVAFADKYGPYGRLVILDHGDHYYTVSGNLAAIDVRVGDQVGAGDRLGTVGTADDSGGKSSLMYFEVRRGTETITPGPWLGL